MKIYTKKGDEGKTHGPRNKQVTKDDLVVSVFGKIDEAQATIGVLYETLRIDKNKYIINNDILLNQLEHLLPYFYQISASIYLGRNEFKEGLDKKLEDWIDLFDSHLKPLHDFILPIGSLSSSYSHLSRVKVRELERIFITWDKDLKFKEIRKFLNRLSDYFFNLSRILSLHEQISKSS